MAQGKKISEEMRNKVISSLLQGFGVNETARATGLAKSTVSKVKRQVPQRLIETGVAKRRELKAERLLDSIAGFLQESVEANTKAFQATENKEWLKAQSAKELAIFIGTVSDKIFRVLEAIETANHN